MEDIIARIKEYVLILNPDLVDDEYLDYVIRDVVDRALLYTNRQQLVAGYERFLDDDYYYGDYYVGKDGKDYPILPIPVEIERSLGRVVNEVYRTLEAQGESEGKSISSISDNGQSISYSDNAVSYLSSQDDNTIFSSVKSLMDKFRIPTIVENT